MPGRKKTPTALAIIKGNPGKRPLPENEPKPGAAKPRAPHVLSEEAKKHWRTVVKQLHAAKVMTRLDIDALALYCEAYARWVEANESLVKYGMIVKSPGGFPMQSPWLSISNKAFEQMRAMLAEFGMTPSSRAKVTTVKENEEKPDGWGEI